MQSAANAELRTNFIIETWSFQLILLEEVKDLMCWRFQNLDTSLLKLENSQTRNLILHSS
jgi:hypothetical protein